MSLINGISITRVTCRILPGRRGYLQRESNMFFGSGINVGEMNIQRFSNDNGIKASQSAVLYKVPDS